MAVRIRSSMEADRFVRERGGRLYVSLQPLGGMFSRLQVATKEPRRSFDFELVQGGGFELLLDRELERPDVVEVSLRRWPGKRLRVRGLRVQGMAAGGGDGGAVGEDDGVLWDSGGGGGGGDGGDGGGGGGNGGGG